jgi:hypothetical protein
MLVQFTCATAWARQSVTTRLNAWGKKGKLVHERGGRHLFSGLGGCRTELDDVPHVG